MTPRSCTGPPDRPRGPGMWTFHPRATRRDGYGRYSRFPCSQRPCQRARIAGDCDTEASARVLWRYALMPGPGPAQDGNRGQAGPHRWCRNRTGTAGPNDGLPGGAGGARRVRCGAWILIMASVRRFRQRVPPPAWGRAGQPRATDDRKSDQGRPRHDRQPDHRRGPVPDRPDRGAERADQPGAEQQVVRGRQQPQHDKPSRQAHQVKRGAVQDGRRPGEQVDLAERADRVPKPVRRHPAGVSSREGHAGNEDGTARSRDRPCRRCRVPAGVRREDVPFADTGLLQRELSRPEVQSPPVAPPARPP